MRSGKGVASSPEPRSVLRPGIWLRIVLSFFFFFTPADCSEVGLEQSLERRGAGGKFASELDLFAHQEEEIQRRGVGVKPRSRNSDVF